MAELTIHTDDLITCNVAARLLDVSRPTIYNFITRHQLHPIILGGNRYLLRTEVEALVLAKLQTKKEVKSGK